MGTVNQTITIRSKEKEKLEKWKNKKENCTFCESHGVNL